MLAPPRAFSPEMPSANLTISQIVDKDSACLGVGTEVAVGVASADHRDMCKFEDVNSQKYSPVKDAIGELVECGIQPKTVERTSKMEGN